MLAGRSVSAFADRERQVGLWSSKPVYVLKGTDYFRIAYDGRVNLPRSLMPTGFRNLCQGFSFDIQSMLLAVCFPFLFQRARLIPRRDFEPGQRQDQRAHADTWFGSIPRPPTPAASEDRCLDVPAGPNAVKRSV